MTMNQQTTALDRRIAGPLTGQIWFDAKFYARPQGVDRDHGTILGCSIVAAGPALGHGVQLDEEFVAKVAELGNAEPAGLKARFGHPNMCSTALGTFLGRWKSFSVEGGKVLANLHLSNSARKTPQGNLYEYVLSMAEKDADMFGVSIVFTRGGYYKRDRDGKKVACQYFDEEGLFGYRNADGKVVEYAEKDDGPLFVECAELHAADAVDEPAANPNGLFSRWTQETLAGQVTEFLDTHPEVLDILTAHPEVVADFQSRYLAHKRRIEGATTMADEAAAAAPAAPPAPEPATPPAAEPAPAALNQPPAEQPPAPPAAEPAPGPVTETLATPPAEDPVESVSLAELHYLSEEYGSEIAVQAILSGGGEMEAARLAVEAARKELAALKAQAGGSPAGFVPKDEPGRKATLKDLFETKRK